MENAATRCRGRKSNQDTLALIRTAPISTHRDYLFATFDKLSVPTDTQWRREKVERAKKTITDTRAWEAAGYLASAEVEIKKLIPD